MPVHWIFLCIFCVLFPPLTMGNCTLALLKSKDLLAYSGISGTDLGDYENCVAQKNAHHCTYSLTQRPPATTPPGHLGLPLAMLGVCVPVECKAGDLIPIITALLPRVPHGHKLSPLALLNSSVVNMCCAEDISHVGSDWLACTMLGVIFGLVVLAIFGTYLDQTHMGSGVWQLLTAFSVSRNINALFHHKTNRTNYLNGIRYLSILWIVFGHLLVFTRPGFRNFLAALPDFMETYAFVFVTTSSFCVDTFFYMGGFLQAYILITRIHKLKGQFLHGVPNLYLLRYLRLTPLLAFVIFASHLLKYAGHGAIWFHFQRSTMWAAADKYWWAILLYINDYVPFRNSYSAGPFQWTWYLANDFQFFLITPPLILLYIYVSKRGVIFLLLAMMVASFIINAIQRTFLQEDAYSHPTNRCPPYIWGLLSAMLMHYLDTASNLHSTSQASASEEFRPSHKAVASSESGSREQHVPLQSRTSSLEESDIETSHPSPRCRGGTWASFLLSVIHNFWTRKVLYACGVLLLGSGSWLQAHRVLGHYGQMYRPDLGLKDWSLEAQSWFSVYYQFCWGLGLALLTTPWAFGYGGIFRRFFEHWAFSALARLTYGVYLVHPFANMWMTYQANTWFILTMTNLILMWIPLTVIATLVSFCCWMLVEKPVANLLELFMRET